MRKKMSAFTLTEVLITVAIIGIVAALTVPNVVKSYQKQFFETSVKKVYVDLQQNLTILQAENYRKKGLSKSILNRGKVKEGDENNKTVEDTAGKFLKQYYKINKDCGLEGSACFTEEYYNIKGDNKARFTCSEGYSITLPSGVAMCLVPSRIETKTEEKCTGMVCIQERVDQEFPATVTIDINGSDEPNVGGRDMFTFNIYEDFSIDEVPPTETQRTKAREELYNNNCLSSPIGEGCFGKLLNDNWKMNY